MKVKSDVEGVGSAGKSASGGTESFFGSLSKGVATAAIVAAAVAGVSHAFKEMYGHQRGAELVDAAKFDIRQFYRHYRDALKTDLVAVGG